MTEFRFLSLKAVAACALALAVGVGVAQTMESSGSYIRSGGIERAKMPQTIWVTDFAADTIRSLTVEAPYTTTNEVGETVSRTLIPAETMQTYDEGGRVTGFYALLTDDDWRNVPEDKTTLTFTITVRGTPGAEFSLGRELGRERYPEKITPGSSEDVPYCVTPGSAARFESCDSSGKYFNGAYYLCASLKAGRRYMFGIADAGYPVTLRLRGTAGDLFAAAERYTDWKDCTDARVIEPAVSGTYIFTVQSGTGQFRFKHMAVPDRLPGKHDHGTLTIDAPASFVPGYLNDPESGYYDEVVDQCLYVFSDCAAGGRYVFRTKGADTNLVMRLYDAKGGILAESRRAAADGFDVQIAWSAKKNAETVYVGVCQRLSKGETPSAGEVTLSVGRIETVEPVTLVQAVPDGVKRSPTACDRAVPTDERSLDAGEWRNVFVIAARAGLTYRVKAKLASGGASNGVAIAAAAYTLSGTKRKDLPAKLVTDSSRIDPTAAGWWEITPDANAAVYLEVFVADGPWGSGAGLSYGPYALYATAACGEGDFGRLQADMGGADADSMGWKLVSGPAVAGIAASKEPYYPAGSQVILPVGGPYAVAARSIGGFQKVNSKGYDVNVYVRGGEVSSAKPFRYFDKADPLDDRPDKKAKEPTTGRAYAPTKLSPSSGKALEVSRSLWSVYEGESYRDTADWFTINAKEGAYYRLSLPWTADAGGAAEVRVYGPGDWTDECAYNVYTEPTNSVRFAAEQGTYYVCVSNTRPASVTDCAYRLRTLMTTPGTIKFAKNAITVKDTSAYADITVNRTGKDGRIRVKYATESDTALPGRDFYPASGELVWENGDNKAKTVRVKLIPDIVTVPLGVTKRLTVRFWTRTWDDPEVNPEVEYIPLFDSKMGDEVTISIAETKKPSAGTVRAVCDNPKKPAFEITAGEALEIPLERVLGTNGLVGVVAETVKGTANKNGETDYDGVTVTNLWADGCGGQGEKTIRIRTKAVPGDYTPQKTFAVKLTALASKKGDLVQYAKPSLAAGSISVAIRNEKFARSVAEWAKAKDLPLGVTGVTEGRKNTWFCADEEGSELYSVDPSSDLTFTLAGPGRFTYDATGDGAFVTNWVKAGSQRLKLSGLTRLYAYSYVQLPAVAPSAPLLDKSTVREGEVEFSFHRIPDDAASGIAYRVYALSAGASRTDAKGKPVKLKLGDAETEVLPAAGRYAAEVWRDAVNKGKWTWRVDSFFVGGTVTNRAKSAWSFTVADESALLPGAELPVTPVSGRDAYGRTMNIVGGDRVVLHRLVKTEFALGRPGSKVTKVAGAVPGGLSLKSVKRPDGLSQAFLVGTPKKAGAFSLVLQEKADKVGGTTTALEIEVEDAGRPEGTFNGLAAVVSGEVGQYRQSVAQVSFTAASSGKLSAKALIGGKSFAFSDTGYTCVRTNEAGMVELEARLVQLQKATVVGSGRTVVFTNELRLAVLEGAVEDASLWALEEPKLELFMRALPDLAGSGYTSGVIYSGTLVRDLTKTKPWVSAIAGFSGYSTVALVPDVEGVEELERWNVPRGNGYLTMTLDAKGKAKVGGALADGASFSASLPVAFGERDGEPLVRLPLYAAKGKSVLAGWLGVRFPSGHAPTEPVTGSWTEEVPVALALGEGGIVWANDDSAAAYDGRFGHMLAIHPVGGWYDTVVNLQRHYIGGDFDHTFGVDTATVDELWQISELIGSNVGRGFDLAADALPGGASVDLAVNNLTVDKQSLSKDSTKTYYVWDDCVNPANVKLTFKRATGILAGTCSVWCERADDKGVPTQKVYANCKHAGVFIMCRDADDLLPDDTVTAGALVVPQTIRRADGSKRTWNANYRFNIKATRRAMDWED